MSELAVLSTFSGAGGDSLGFKLAGFDVQMAVDIDKDCCQTYAQNLREVDVYRKDAQTLSLVRNDFDGMLVTPEVRTFAGGSQGTPCQGSSPLNHAKVGEERNELVFVPIRHAVEGNFKFFLIENVPTFELKEELMQAGRDAGYHMFAKELWASDYGVPQRRKRWFCLGLRDYDTFHWPEPIRGPIPTVQKTMDLMERIWGESTKTSSRMLEAMEELDNSPLKWLTISGKRWKNGVCWKLDAPAPCVVNPSKSYQKIVGVPGKIPLSLLAMIQGFPNQWKFSGSMSSIGQQIVNACPPILVRAIALQIKRRLGL